VVRSGPPRQEQFQAAVIIHRVVLALLLHQQPSDLLCGRALRLPFTLQNKHTPRWAGVRGSSWLTRVADKGG